MKASRIEEKIGVLKQKMQALKTLEVKMLAAPDKQISLTDPDARAIATNVKTAGVVGYNVQAAVETKHHLIVAHEVTNVVSDRGHLSKMAKKARVALQAEDLTVLADRGYYKSEELLACHEAGITTYIPKPETSNAQAAGRFARRDFHYDAETDTYSLSSGRSSDPAYDVTGGRAHSASLLERQLSTLYLETPMHTQQGTTRVTLGA